MAGCPGNWFRDRFCIPRAAGHRPALRLKPAIFGGSVRRHRVRLGGPIVRLPRRREVIKCLAWTQARSWERAVTPALIFQYGREHGIMVSFGRLVGQLKLLHSSFTAVRFPLPPSDAGCASRGTGSGRLREFCCRTGVSSMAFAGPDGRRPGHSGGDSFCPLGLRTSPPSGFFSPYSGQKAHKNARFRH